MEDVSRLKISYEEEISRLKAQVRVQRNILEARVDEERAHMREQFRELEKTRLALMNLLEDIEQEKKISEARAEDLKKFKMAVDNAYSSIIITDESGTILYANKSCKGVTGYSTEEVIGKTPALWGGLMDKTFYEDMWRTIKVDKKIFLGELKNKHKSGRPYFAEILISPITNDAGEVKFFVSLERDITERKALNDARTSFISIASHQLRTPLTSMRWFSEMLMDGDAGDITSSQRHFVERIYEGTNRMIDLVNLLLQIARVEAGRVRVDPVPTDIVAFIQKVVQTFSSAAEEKKMKIELKVGSKPLPQIPIDRDIMWQVAQNLISNAIRYSIEGGVITLSLEMHEHEVVFSVADRGIGIPDNYQNRIFEKFFRAANALKKVPEGSGLGLNLVKLLVEGWSGKIWFESIEGKGTTFHISIPIEGMKARTGEVTLAV